MARLIIGVGDLAATGESGDVIVTHALGSCVAIIVRELDNGVCAMAHAVIPGEPPPGEAHKPAYHAPAAVRNVLGAVRRVGGAGRLQVALVGGAAVLEGLSVDVGRRNVLAVRRALWAQGIVPVAEEVGGTISRTVVVEAPNGEVKISSPTLGTWTLEQERR